MLLNTWFRGLGIALTCLSLFVEWFLGTMASNLSMALSYEVGTPVLKLFYGFRESFVVANTCLFPTLHARTRLMESRMVGVLLEVGLRLPL